WPSACAVYRGRRSRSRGTASRRGCLHRRSCASSDAAAEKLPGRRPAHPAGCRAGGARSGRPAPRAIAAGPQRPRRHRIWRGAAASPTARSPWTRRLPVRIPAWAALLLVTPPRSSQSSNTEAALKTWTRKLPYDGLLPPISSMLLYACTIFLSAFLLFQVQPLIAKMILPWFGGSAAVWTACVLFFQLLLLLGYLYSHWTVRYLRPKTQTILHIAVLAASLLMLPAIPNAAWKPAGGEDPTLRILGLLGATIGLPYLLLSTTGPLIQAWFVRERLREGGSAYRLYALSNLGSMQALFSYPALVEPYFATEMQGYAWSAGYVAFILFCGGAAWRGLTRFRGNETPL